MGGRKVTTGAPFPLGVWPDGGGVNVAVWSAGAQAVDLCLFDAEGRETRVRLPERTGEVFHGHVQGVAEGDRYGLRAYGPWDPGSGSRFDPAKLLVDPYAVALDGPFVLHPSMFSEGAPGVDSAPFTPKALVSAPAPPTAPPLHIPWDRTVIYEAQLKGLTRLHPDVPEHQRGTFAALARPAVIDHLTSLGVTTLELMPTAAWIDERRLRPLGLSNAWGYNSITFAAPDPRLAPGGWAEVRAATAALAEAGIETVLDVVFNHTGEGDAFGPTLSLRGLDNAGYYRLHPADPARYIDDTGTGNTLALDRPQGVALVMHALRQWVRRGGVSGFRFDLATVLGRRPDGFDPAAPLLAAIEQDPELSGLKMIAEPWDCGPGGHQLGRFPGRWGEWNDGFRDRVRRFWRGDPMRLGELAESLAGSEPALRTHRRPSRGINFITAHDGFTLADLVSYEAKHNEANGEQNRDGTDHNLSWNNGAEGPTSDPAIEARRAADQRALLATLLLSRGTPMLSMGAELGRSQGGNNNAYAQDNAVNWLDWAKADDALLAFTRRLLKARAECRALREDRFLTGQVAAHGYPDVQWRGADGEPMTGADWDDPAGGALTCVLAAGQDGASLSRAVIVINRGKETLARPPEPRDGYAWRLALDSSDDGRGGLMQGEELPLNPRSVILLIEEPAAARPRGVNDADLAALAERAGVALEWWTLAGERRLASPDTQRAILSAMGLPIRTGGDVREAMWRLAEPERSPLPWTMIVASGGAATVRVNAPDGWLELDQERGQTLPLRVRQGRCELPPLPLGRHRLRLGDVACHLITAPAAAYEPEPPARRLGISAQLYALRGRRDGGIGDLDTLAELAEGAAAEGLALVGINPLHALFPTDRSRVSPYYPSDRRFLDPIYIATPQILAAPPSDQVDYAAVWAAKSAVLERAFAAFEGQAPDPDFETFVAEGGQALRQFSLFQAIAERHPDQPWSRWPGGLDDAHGGAPAAFARAHPQRLRFHAWLQWRADRQLGAARRPGVGFLRDLAVGPAPDGAETWAGRGLFARGVTIGAPPDAFSPQGQSWGLPPPLPAAWIQEGYDSFSRLLRSNMRHAAALRIDHALGLARLFWIPEGAGAAEGTYVRYPMDELLSVIALESVRAGCLVVGEDLGTVPDDLRGALQSRRIYSYKVLPFERDESGFRAPDAYPARALACVATHDLPPLAGWWAGDDLDERRRLGLLDQAAFEAASAQRALDKQALIDALERNGLTPSVQADGALSNELAAAIHALVARTPSLIVTAQVEDLAGERDSVNVPGTHLERPNWRRRLPLPLADLWSTPRCRAILAALR